MRRKEIDGYKPMWPITDYDLKNVPKKSPKEIYEESYVYLFKEQVSQMKLKMLMTDEDIFGNKEQVEVENNMKHLEKNERSLMEELAVGNMINASMKNLDNLKNIKQVWGSSYLRLNI